MFYAVVDLEVWSSEDGRPDLPSETRSMLYRFRDEAGTEVNIGANAVDQAGERFASGTRHNHVTLAFWGEVEARRLLRPGASFVVWYARDIGDGTVLRVSEKDLPQAD